MVAASTTPVASTCTCDCADLRRSLCSTTVTPTRWFLLQQNQNQSASSPLATLGLEVTGIPTTTATTGANASTAPAVNGGAPYSINVTLQAYCDACGGCTARVFSGVAAIPSTQQRPPVVGGTSLSVQTSAALEGLVTVVAQLGGNSTVVQHSFVVDLVPPYVYDMRQYGDTSVVVTFSEPVVMDAAAAAGVTSGPCNLTGWLPVGMEAYVLLFDGAFGGGGVRGLNRTAQRGGRVGEEELGWGVGGG